MTINLYDKLLVKHQDLGLYSGGIAITPEDFTGHPKLNWTGAFIDLDQFRIALAFLKWTHTEHKVEGQVRLFYNELTREWKAVALPQYIWSAGHTREVEENDPIKSSIIEDLLIAGFGQAGTGHHHSMMGAFQSGGDKEDELSQNGFHFTVGHMGSAVADFHCRATFRKINYDPERGMLDPNQWLPGLHNQLIRDKEIAALWLDLTALPPFPETWKTYLRKKPEPAVVHGWSGYGFGQPASVWKAPQATGGVEIFRDNGYCIAAKVKNTYCTPPIRITPKSRLHIVSSQPTPSTPQPSPVNALKTEKFDRRTTTYDALVEHVALMSEAGFATFCQNLREDAFPEIPVHDLNTPRGRVINRLEECLVEFRFQTLSDTLSAVDLKIICDALGATSFQLANTIERVARRYSSDNPQLPLETLRETLTDWSAVLFDRVISFVSHHEWTVLLDGDPINFHETLLTGLKREKLNGTLDADCNSDGTIDVPH